MIINGRELDATVYGVQGRKVAIVEDKEDVLYFSGIESVPEGLDVRALTFMYTLDEENKEVYGYDHFIMTYDINTLLSDPDMAEAIIAHEIGHIMHPVESYDDVEASTHSELMADAHAISLGYAKPLYDFLYMARTQLHELGSDVMQLDIRLSALEKAL